MTTAQNPSQTAAIHSESPAICLMAGPGSGKTKTLLERAQVLTEKEVSANLMVMITFTNAAAKMLTDRTDLEFQFCGTLHGYMLRLISEFGGRIGIHQPLTVINEEAQKVLLSEVIEECGYKGKLGDLQAALDVGPYELKQSAKTSFQSKAQTTALAYYQKLIGEALTDYDSILHLGLAVIKQLDTWDLKVSALFVDEMQDTAPIDMLIYDALPIANKFYVGDVDQSIYGWRGATTENMLQLAARDDVEVMTLEDNYRCDSEITAAAQRLIEHNIHRPNKVTVSATGKKGEVIIAPPLEDQIDEVIYMARQINELPDASQVAVLVRTNRAKKFYQDALRGHGVDIPRDRYSKLPSDFNKISLYLSLLANPNNNRIAHQWLEETQGKKAAAAIRLKSKKDQESINNTALHLPTEPDPQGVIGSLSKMEVSAEMMTRIEKVASDLPEQFSLSELVTSLQSSVKLEQLWDRGKGVTVCTIHAAKGCEWDCGFIPQMEQGNLPRMSKGADIEEDRRLLFVALTRFRRCVTITYSKMRDDLFTYQEKVMEPSQFIAEMGF